MTINQAIQEIQSEHKWWASEHKKEETWNRITANNILLGTAKQATIKKFLNKFGYEIEINVRKSIGHAERVSRRAADTHDD